MENNKKQNENSAFKQQPGHVKGSNEEQTRQKTEPLDENASHLKDEQEGDMDNGEIGNDLDKGR